MTHLDLEVARLRDLVTSRLHLLAVEDEPGDARILENMLEQLLGPEGYKLETATNTAEARAIVDAGGLDAVLLDYDLGAENGFSMFGEEAWIENRVPVIVITGKGDERIAAEALRLGVSDYLVKTELGPAELARCLLRILNVTELRRAQFLAEARLATAASGTMDSIITKDLTGKILSWNQAAQRIFGWQANEVIGQSIHRIVPPDLRDELDMILENTKDGNAIKGLQTTRIDKAGRPVQVSLTVSPIYDARGQIMGATEVAHDLGPVLQMQGSIDEGKRQLEVDNLLLKEFGHVLAHDLREPLRGLLLRIDMLEREMPDNARVLSAKEAAERLRAMMEGFETMAGLRATRAPEPIDLEAAVRDVVAALQLRIEEAGADVEVGALPETSGDPAQVFAILQNLITNAIRYGGSPPTIHIDGQLGTSMVEVRITDNGKGIPEQYRQRIFQPFQRGAHHGTPGGTGMGLFVARILAQRQDGRLTIEKSDAEGTTFLLELPRA